MKFECFIEDIRASLRNYGVEPKVINAMSDYEILEADDIATEEELDEYLDNIRKRCK